MPTGFDADAFCQGKSASGVTFSFSFQDLENLPDVKSMEKGHKWTAEEDEALLRFWPRKNKRAVAKALGVCDTVARRRYNELTGEA